jgi:hypothetical protein
MFMLRRKGWDGNHTYQIINDSDSRKGENKPISPILTPEGKIEESLASWAKSSNFVKLKKHDFSDGVPADPDQWFLITDQTNYPRGIEKVWLRIDNKTAPEVAIKLASDARKLNPQEILKGGLCGGNFEKKKEKKARGNTPGEPAKTADEVMLEFWKDEISHLRAGEIIRYKGSKTYGGVRKAALASVKPVNKLE